MKPVLSKIFHDTRRSWVSEPAAHVVDAAAVRSAVSSASLVGIVAIQTHVAFFEGLFS